VAPINRQKIHQVRGVFEKPEEAIQFFTSAGFSLAAADYISKVADNPRLREIMEDIRKGDRNKRYSDVLEALRGYRIAKLIALDSTPASVRIRQRLVEFTIGQKNEEEFLADLFVYVLGKNEETAVKTGLNGNGNSHNYIT